MKEVVGKAGHYVNHKARLRIKVSVKVKVKEKVILKGKPELQKAYRLAQALF